MSWSVGFTGNPAVDELFDGDMSFPQGMRLLRVFVRRELKNSDELLISEWSETYSNINDICNDTGTLEDPDQWEDLEFDSPIGAFWIVQN